MVAGVVTDAGSVGQLDTLLECVSSANREAMWITDVKIPGREQQEMIYSGEQCKGNQCGN